MLTWQVHFRSKVHRREARFGTKQLLRYTDSPSLSCPSGAPLASGTAAGGAGGGPPFFPRLLAAGGALVAFFFAAAAPFFDWPAGRTSLGTWVLRCALSIESAWSTGDRDDVAKQSSHLGLLAGDLAELCLGQPAVLPGHVETGSFCPSRLPVVCPSCESTSCTATEFRGTGCHKPNASQHFRPEVQGGTA